MTGLRQTDGREVWLFFTYRRECIPSLGPVRSRRWNPTQSRAGAPHIGLFFLDCPVDVEEGHAWLHCVVRVAVINMDNLGHTLQVEYDRALILMSAVIDHRIRGVEFSGLP